MTGQNVCCGEIINRLINCCNVVQKLNRDKNMQLYVVVDFKRDPRPGVSEPAKDLVRRMLDPNPITRLTAAQVLGEHYGVSFSIA